MSEQDNEQPLTRREMRMREQAERASVESTDESAATAAAAAEAASEEDVIDTSSIEIDPLNPDGTPRTRREMRELREAAIAELLAEREAAAGDAEEPAEAAAVPADPDADADSYGAPTEALSLEDLPAAEAAEDELDAPTEAFTLEDILDAAEPTSPTGDAEAVASLFATGESEAIDAEDVAGDSEPVEPEADLADADADAEAEVALDEDLVAEDLDASAVVPDADAVAAEDEEPKLPEAEGAEDTGTDTAGYSFPDIQPPEEWRSVFDDPSRAATINAPGDSGDFDDLISRAVAQEGSTGGTGASALILPTHPGDTGSLTGPLGATGELYVTGSIELPKSMGETGGHSGIHDSIEFDQFLTGETEDAITSTSESGPMPVSAMNAVSARRRPEVPVVAEPTKDRSKVPLILALSGGGLIVVVVGGVVWAASQGLFN